MRARLENIQQRGVEDVLAYNRKFNTTARDAFPEPRHAEHQERLITMYGRGLKSSQLARKMALHEPFETIELAQAYVLALTQGKERYDRLGRKVEAMEIGLVDDDGDASPEGTAGLIKMLKSQGKELTRLTNTLGASKGYYTEAMRAAAPEPAYYQQDVAAVEVPAGHGNGGARPRFPAAARGRRGQGRGRPARGRGGGPPQRLGIGSRKRELLPEEMGEPVDWERGCYNCGSLKHFRRWCPYPDQRPQVYSSNTPAGN